MRNTSQQRLDGRKWFAGWYVSRRLRRTGAETGLIAWYNRGSTPPVKIQPNQIPTGLDRISQKAALNIKSISGINDSMLGTDSAEVSGVAIQAKQNRGAIMIRAVG